jgi:hypothetical protein
MSLAELIVAMALSVLLLVVMGGFFTAIVRGTQAASAADGSTRQSSNAINTMVQYLHAATNYPIPTQTTPLPAFVSVAATDVTFYAYVNLVSSAEQPVKVRYFIDPSSHNLIEQLWSSTCSATTQYCTFSTTVTSQYTLGGPVASPTSDSKPLFSYLNSSGNPIVVPLSITDPTTAATLASIDYVGINLELGSTKAGSTGDTHVSTVVGLLNLGQSGAGTS